MITDEIIVTVKYRVCPWCKKNRRASSFWKDRRTSHGLQVYCKTCTYKIRRSNDSYKTASRKWYHKKGYIKKSADFFGITVEEYNVLIKVAEGRCEICKRKPEEINRKYKRLCIDHNHNTNKVRGVLCAPCNLALGNAQDSPDILVRMANYLNERKG